MKGLRSLSLIISQVLRLLSRFIMSTTKMVKVVRRAKRIAMAFTSPKLLLMLKGEVIRAAKPRAAIIPEAIKADPMRLAVIFRALNGSASLASSS